MKILEESTRNARMDSRKTKRSKKQNRRQRP